MRTLKLMQVDKSELPCMPALVHGYTWLMLFVRPEKSFEVAPTHSARTSVIFAYQERTTAKHLSKQARVRLVLNVISNMNYRICRMAEKLSNSKQSSSILGL